MLYCLMLWSGEGRPALFLLSSFFNHFMREADGVRVGNLLNLSYSLFLPFFLSFSLYFEFPVQSSRILIYLFIFRIDTWRHCLDFLFFIILSETRKFLRCKFTSIRNPKSRKKYRVGKLTNTTCRKIRSLQIVLVKLQR